ncbi:hypothetical protein [Streptomyces sp. NBC_01794]|uniref:hypothetical protein n=1 Tax=Streptomyces sp. NBC_01794 TaxID=2975942 RepID=UPI0030857FD0|nr:hypothetical protein OIE54_00340 [Streptomyces sp. NBC_01794]WSB05744.1 hypothetical protein OIE54_41805 [Streptomyces sp. NBC_01794]
MRAVPVFRVIARCSSWVSASRSRFCSSVIWVRKSSARARGSFLDVECVEQGLDVHAVTACGSRQVEVVVPVSRRVMVWVIAQ